MQNFGNNRRSKKKDGIAAKEKKNIVLIGYRAAGKTRVSKILSKKLGLPLISIDKTIEEKTKLPIAKLVETYGWEKFRDIEGEIVKSVSCSKNHIIDPGGGVILREENTINLKKNSIIIWLRADVETTLSRLKKMQLAPRLQAQNHLLMRPQRF
jgi:shikimate kinase